MQYLTTGETHNTQIYISCFSLSSAIFPLLPFFYPYNISYSSFLLSISSFYLNKALISCGWWLQSPKLSVCSSNLHFSVVYITKPRRRDSILCHPPCFVISFFFFPSFPPALSFCLFLFSTTAVHTFHSEALTCRTRYCL